MKESCSLCKGEVDVKGLDFGRGTGFNCISCGYYEITSSVLTKISDKDFPEQYKLRIIQQLKHYTDPKIISTIEGIGVIDSNESSIKNTQ